MSESIVIVVLSGKTDEQRFTGGDKGVRSEIDRRYESSVKRQSIGAEARSGQIVFLLRVGRGDCWWRRKGGAGRQQIVAGEFRGSRWH